MACCPGLARSKVPPRFYWKTLAGTNAVPAIFQSLNGNANPLDPAHVVLSDGEFTANLLTAGYAKLLPIKGRNALIALLVPMGTGRDPCGTTRPGL